ncbi:MAG TPA: hypothetical protein PK018_12015, partial [Candidatus Competibacter sp.]|nr:hypothetical protein [Candidatus Competibacter sp.]HRW64657.1 hypothetical protein [Candidatus Competibacter sp.]
STSSHQQHSLSLIPRGSRKNPIGVDRVLKNTTVISTNHAMADIRQLDHKLAVFRNAPTALAAQ